MGYVYKLSGRVDSANAGNLEKDIFAEYEKEGELSIGAGR